MTRLPNSLDTAVERPQTPSVFLFHEPLPNSRLTSNRSSSQVVPWADVITSIIADPKERAASMVMQTHAPLLGSAIPCSLTLSPSGSLLEITLCSRRSGIQPVELGSEKIRIVLASVELVRTQLPEAADGDDDESHAARRACTWGNELAGSPMRGLRVCLTVSGDPAQQTSDWSSTFRENRAASFGDLPPRHVVLYATGLRDAQHWVAWLRQRTAKRELIGVSRLRDTAASRADAIERTAPSSTFAIRPNNYSDDGRPGVPLSGVAGSGGPNRTWSDGGQTQDSLTSNGNGEVHDDDDQELQDHAAWRFTTAAQCHSLQDAIPQGSTTGGYRSLFEVKEAARLARAAGRWCPFGEEWMRGVSPLVMRALLRWMPKFDGGSVYRSTPWIPCLLDGPTENCDRRHAIALEVLWRLSTTTRPRGGREEGGDKRFGARGTVAERGSSAVSAMMSPGNGNGERPRRGLSYLQRRAHYLSADEFRVFSESKYLEAEEVLGRRIDAIRARLREGTQTLF